MKIEEIDINQLRNLQALLSKNLGENVSIKDEVEYFKETKPKHWYVALNKLEKPIGYIRHFKFLDNTMSEIELYNFCDIEIKKSLIDKFDKSLKNQENLIVRIRLNHTDIDLKDHLKNIGFRYKEEIFLKYIYSDKTVPAVANSVRFANDSLTDLKNIKEVLSEFQELSDKDIKQFIAENRLIVCSNNNNIIGVCLCNLHSDSIEIIEFTISSSFRKQGFGQELLKGAIALYRETKPEIKFRLKVAKENAVAQKLYAKVGFTENTNEAEIWLSKQYTKT